MKKIFALSVASLLMIGAASQASAAFEEGNFIMSIYDQDKDQEMGIDLGVIDFSGQNVILKSGLDFTGWSTEKLPGFHQSGVGLYANWFDTEDESLTKLSAWFGITNDTGTAAISSNTGNAVSFQAFDGFARGIYARNVGPVNGVALIAASETESYFTNFTGQGAAPGGYGGMQLEAGMEGLLPTAGNYEDLYVYEYGVDMTTFETIPVGDSYLGVIRLTGEGDIILNPTASSDVPVPGAVWLLGSGLAGLAGIRRRKNS